MLAVDAIRSVWQQQCAATFDGYSCTCKNGWSGMQCQTRDDTDDCADNSCCNGVCRDSLNSYKCTCLPGAYATPSHDPMRCCYIYSTSLWTLNHWISIHLRYSKMVSHCRLVWRRLFWSRYWKFSDVQLWKKLYFGTGIAIDCAGARLHRSQPRRAWHDRLDGLWDRAVHNVRLRALPTNSTRTPPQATTARFWGWTFGIRAIA